MQDLYNKEQLGTLNRIIKLDNIIALDSYIGQRMRGSCRFVRERQLLVLFWGCAYRI